MKGGEKIMYNSIKIPVPGLDLAARIQPAETVASNKAQLPSGDVQSRDSFDKVLARVEGGNNGRDLSKRAEGIAKPVERSKNSNGKSDSVSAPAVADTGSQVVNSELSAKTATSNGSSANSQTSTVQGDSGGGQASHAPIVSGVTNSAPTAIAEELTAGINQTLLSTLLSSFATGTANEPAIGDLQSVVPGNPQADSVNITKDTFLPNLSVLTDSVENVSREVIEPGNPQDARLIRQDNPVLNRREDIPQPDLSIASRDASPAYTRGSEWTGILEFSRLLNPTVEKSASSPASRDNPAENLPSRNIVAPRTDDSVLRLNSQTGKSRFEDTVRFVNDRTNFSDSVGSRANYQPNPAISQDNRMPLILNSTAPVAYESGIFRPVAEIAQTATPAGTAVSAEMPVQPIARFQPVDFTARINPENLVSDIKEAFMRIGPDGRGEARIVLHPPELGELVVRLESSRNGVVRAEFHTISPLVREALESGLERLTNALKSEGLTLSHAEVHLDMHPGPEGRSGESDSRSSEGSLYNSDEDAQETGISPGAGTEFVSLPEGATICVYA